MTATVLTFPLIDGPLSTDCVMTARANLIHRMARDLVVAGTYADHDDSVITLLRVGYAAFDAMALIDDVRQVAMQHVVATEMGS